MIYTVGEMAQKLGVPASTLRYYDKEGLLPFVERSSGGIRMFRENDFEWLQVIRCMKKAGMSIKDIRQYIELSMQGDDTIDTRLELFRHQREVLTQPKLAFVLNGNAFDSSADTKGCSAKPTTQRAARLTAFRLVIFCSTQPSSSPNSHPICPIWGLLRADSPFWRSLCRLSGALMPAPPSACGAPSTDLTAQTAS